MANLDSDDLNLGASESDSDNDSDSRYGIREISFEVEINLRNMNQWTEDEKSLSATEEDWPIGGSVGQETSGSLHASLYMGNYHSSNNLTSLSIWNQ